MLYGLLMYVLAWFNQQHLYNVIYVKNDHDVLGLVLYSNAEQKFAIRLIIIPEMPPREINHQQASFT